MALIRADWEGADLAPVVDDADVIYFTGGDPWYLLRTIRDTLLLVSTLRAFAA